MVCDGRTGQATIPTGVYGFGRALCMGEYEGQQDTDDAQGDQGDDDHADLREVYRVSHFTLVFFGYLVQVSDGRNLLGMLVMLFSSLFKCTTLEQELLDKLIFW